MTNANRSKDDSILTDKKTVKYILLDIHGVLTAGDERKTFLAKMAKDYNMDYDQHNAVWSNHIENLDKGTEKEADYIKLVNKTFNTNLSVKEYYLRFVQEIKANIPLLEMLSAIENIEIYIASDNVPEISVCLNDIFGKNFQKYKKFYSFELGVTKAKGMLKEIVSKLNIQPNECLFIDDSSRNIEVAKGIGINAILFKTNEELFNELKQYHLDN